MSSGRTAVGRRPALWIDKVKQPMGGSVSPPVAGRIEPADDCVKCARLAEFRNDNKRRFPNFFNAPAPPRGPVKAPVMIVGLAPALRGANRTGVTFGGDRSADFLLAAMDRVGLAADPNSDQTGCRLTNAVKCVPPENRPLGAEIRAPPMVWSRRHTRSATEPVPSRPRAAFCSPAITRHSRTRSRAG